MVVCMRTTKEGSTPPWKKSLKVRHSRESICKNKGPIGAVFEGLNNKQLKGRQYYPRRGAMGCFEELLPKRMKEPAICKRSRRNEVKESPGAAGIAYAKERSRKGLCVLKAYSWIRLWVLWTIWRDCLIFQATDIDPFHYFEFSLGKYSSEEGPSERWFARGTMVNAYAVSDKSKKAQDPIFGLAMGEASQVSDDYLR
ncbi:hypothetical protein L7F22_031433 [Adiantum nelumboides]|nr:hypothetical protein [Adiantum nelumboides]